MAVANNRQISYAIAGGEEQIVAFLQGHGVSRRFMLFPMSVTLHEMTHGSDGVNWNSSAYEGHTKGNDRMTCVFIRYGNAKQHLDRGLVSPTPCSS